MTPQRRANACSPISTALSLQWRGGMGPALINERDYPKYFCEHPGRPPNGMSNFGRVIPPQQMYELAAFDQS